MTETLENKVTLFEMMVNEGTERKFLTALAGDICDLVVNAKGNKKFWHLNPDTKRKAEKISDYYIDSQKKIVG